MDSLPGVMWHLSDAWARRGQPNMVLRHYDDLSADLDGRDAPPGRPARDRRARRPAGPALVEAASFEQMRANSADLVSACGILKDSAAFFRRGTSGAGAESSSLAELAALPGAHRPAGAAGPARLAALPR